MANTHIIVGPQRRCLCGQYGDRAVLCAEILAALDTLDVEARRVALAVEPEILLLKAALGSMLQDCTEPPTEASLAEEARMLCYAIEDLPASEQQTAVSLEYR